MLGHIERSRRQINTMLTDRARSRATGPEGRDARREYKGVGNRITSSRAERALCRTSPTAGRGTATTSSPPATRSRTSPTTTSSRPVAQRQAEGVGWSTIRRPAGSRVTCWCRGGVHQVAYARAWRPHRRRPVQGVPRPADRHRQIPEVQAAHQERPAPHPSTVLPERLPRARRGLERWSTRRRATSFIVEDGPRRAPFPATCRHSPTSSPLTTTLKTSPRSPRSSARRPDWPTNHRQRRLLGGPLRGAPGSTSAAPARAGPRRARRSRESSVGGEESACGVSHRDGVTGLASGHSLGYREGPQRPGPAAINGLRQPPE